MRACLSVVRCCSLLLGLGVILGTPAVGWAQGQLRQVEVLKKNFADSAAAAKRNKLMTGEESPGKDAVKIATDAAEYYLYRLTHVTETPADVHKDFTKAIDYALETRKATNRAFLDLYLAPALVKCMKDVLELGPKGFRFIDPNRNRFIDATMMLPTMARLKSDAINEYLIDVVNNPKTDNITRLYALKAFKEAMPITQQLKESDFEPKDKAQNERRQKETNTVKALTDFIERPVDFAGLSYEEASAIRFIRREAIIALAQAGSPAVMAYDKKIGKKDAPDGPVAPTLLKVLAGQLQPPPSLQEKIEAAIGLCNLKHTEMPAYNPALATYLIGQTIFDLSNEYSKDLPNFVVGAEKQLPYLAWKTESRRLKQGLDLLVKNANTKQAAELKIHADPILDAWAGYAQPNPTKLGELRLKVQSLRPADGKVFNVKMLPKAPEIPLGN